jgi:hypothetical protein
MLYTGPTHLIRLKFNQRTNSMHQNPSLQANSRLARPFKVHY